MGKKKDVQIVALGQLNPKTNNRVSTTKYSLISFVPRFLFEQFQSPVNIFFLCISIIQLTPSLSPLGAHGTILPFTFILMLTAGKEVYEDFKRFRSDRQVNNRLVQALFPPVDCPKKPSRNAPVRWAEIYWHKLTLGQIVKVRKDEHIPADLILLSSSEPAGMAYIETANLDGESNLKIRQALTMTSVCVSDQQLEFLASSGSFIRCEAPNCLIYDFSGCLELHKSFSNMYQPTESTVGTGSRTAQSNKEFDSIPLTNGHLLPRGSRLKNTDWVYGVIVYAGKHTKLMMNSTKTPSKKSFVNSMLNYLMTFQFGLLVLLCNITTLCSIYFYHKEKSRSWYLPVEGRSSFIVHFLGKLSIYDAVMPISLIVTLETIRLLQAIFIENDIEMYDEVSNTHCIVRRSNLNETLGQVKYVLSDKTGTLTENKMIFKMCSINGVVYGEKEGPGFKSELLLNHLNSTNKASKKIKEFLTIVSVCHTVIPEKPVDGTTKVNYHASSPDEAALVNMARDFGFVFHNRTPEYITVDVEGKPVKYYILSVLEFTSERKRMGVIAKTEDGKIKLFVKGADSTILPRLSPDCDRNVVLGTLNSLRRFANLGFRTLCLAYRDVTEEEYLKWEPGYYAACTSLEERREKVDAQAELIESNLILCGVSAIEDKLQLGVPETIKRLAMSNIKIWILTGDKLETAINIGHSSLLIKPDMTTYVLAPKNLEETGFCMVRRVFAEIENNNHLKTGKAALIIDGSTLQKLTEEGVSYEFVNLALNAGCVICCRCTPRQKAAMVKLVKQHIDGATLAIGDGANDVAMIQAADVGVGISGEEGLQASLAADYAIAQFRFLERLLLVHGTLCCMRTIRCINYTLYKNSCEIFILACYFWFSGFSDTVYFDTNCMMCFSVFFTWFPPIVYGVFDKIAPIDQLQADPVLYRLSQKPNIISIKSHLFTLLESAVHGILIFFSVYLFTRHDLLWSDGKVGGLHTIGTMAFTVLVVFSNVKAVVESDSISVVTLMSCTLSIFMYLAFLFLLGVLAPVFDGLADGDMIDIFWIHFTTPSVFFGVSFTVALPLIVNFVASSLYAAVSRKKKKKVRFHEDSELETLLNPFSTIYRAIKRDPDGKRQLRSQRTSFAFSQEENGTVHQSDLIRAYDSTRPKKAGTPISSDRAVRFSGLRKGSEDTTSPITATAESGDEKKTAST